MTTAQSPLKQLKRQATEIAETMCAFERGESVDPRFAAQMTKSRKKESVSIAIWMDDKIVTLELTWAKIRGSGPLGLAEYILGLMREQRNTLH